MKTKKPKKFIRSVLQMITMMIEKYIVEIDLKRYYSSLL